jgi:threonine/homoserine/homoserine lactone efflux protein
MPPTDHLLAFALAAFLIILAPGPSVLFVISRALAYGRRTALITVVGGAVGSFVSACLVAAGLGALVQSSAIAYTVLKYVGAAYLIYLGVRAFRQRRKLREVWETQASGSSARRTWWQGFVVAVTNPKTAVFFAAILPQFVDPVVGHASLQMIVFGAIFAIIALLSDSVYGLTAGTARQWFTRSDRRLELVGGASGVTMIGLGVGIAFTGKKD